MLIILNLVLIYSLIPLNPLKQIVANGKHDSRCEAEQVFSCWYSVIQTHAKYSETEKSVSLFLLIILTGNRFYSIT